MIKVLFCVDSLNKGGAERVVSNLANYLSNCDSKFDVNIATLRKTEIGYPLNDNVKHFVLEKGRKNKLLNNFSKIKSLYDIVKNNHIDLIISFLPKSSLNALLIKYFINVKVIASERNDPKKEYNSFFRRLLKKIFFRKCDGMVFQTNDAKDFFDDVLKCPTKIILNPVNDKFKNVKRDKVCKEIVSVGRLQPQKNQKLLIDAFSKFYEKNKDYTLTIYGEGKLRSSLEKQIDELGLNDVIKLPGNIDNVETKIVNAKMFVFSSDYEGLPNALIEAMVLGIPCISTDCPCGGPRSLIINEKNGLLVPVGDVDFLFRAMDTLVNDNVLYKKIEKNSKNIIDKVDGEIVYKQWLDFIYKILK